MLVKRDPSKDETISTVPVSLQVVGGLFILLGILAILEMFVVLLFFKDLLCNPYVLTILIGWELLNLRKIGWLFAIVMNLALVAYNVKNLVYYCVQEEPFSLHLFGQNYGYAPRWSFVLFCVAILLLLGWQLYVLLRPSVRKIISMDSTKKLKMSYVR